MSSVGEPSVLVIHASTHGHTAKIAAHLAEAMASYGANTVTRDVTTNSAEDPVKYDAVVVAASIHRGHYQREMLDWVKEHRMQLDLHPNAFISVSLTAAEDSSEAREATAKCLNDFREESGWRPDRCEQVAGALQYQEYDAFTRVFMRLLMKSQGHPTDTSHDYDFTDWDALEKLGEELATSFSGSQGQERVRTG